MEMIEATKTSEQQVTLRTQLLEGLASETKTLRWAEDIGFGWFCGYYLLLLNLSPLAVAWLPFSSDVRVILWLLFPVPVAGIAWWNIRRKSVDQYISFDAMGFRFYKGRDCYFEQSWAWISNIKVNRGAFVITKKGGDVQTVPVPAVKRTRDSDLFRKIFRTYVAPSDDRLTTRKWLITSLALVVVGAIFCFAIGRPEMLRRDYEGPIGPTQIMMAIWWGFSGCILVMGVVGFMVVGSAHFLRADRLKRRKLESRFGPNIQAFLESCEQWPKQVDLVEGTKYRYLDPDGIAKSLKDQITTIWFTVFFGSLLGLGGCLAAIFGNTRLKQNYIGLLVLSIVVLIASLLSLLVLKTYKRRLASVDDIFFVDGSGLQVERDGVVKTYLREPRKKIKNEEVPASSSGLPFYRLEKHGDKQNLYEIDRRYLMEIPDQD